MKKKAILLIEPDALLAKIYQRYLEKFSFEVNICGDSQDAINNIDKKMPDIIILEIQLTSHNGFEFLYELRSYPEWQSIPIIINSVVHPSLLGFNEGSIAHLGISEIIYKPNCSLSKLLYATRQYALVG